MLEACYAGVMSGTSLDGIDAVIATFFETPQSDSQALCKVLGSAFVPFPQALRATLLALQTTGADELVRTARAANELAELYAQAVQEAMRQAGIIAADIKAVGVHGQTVRHCPGEGWSCQLNNPARVAELLGIDIVADFRSRDLAAGGQGAPLVPAFHAAIFGGTPKHRVIVNIGGIANITDLPLTGFVRGFDTGPGNVLLDAWYTQHHSGTFDRDGRWAASGEVSQALLKDFLSEPYFRMLLPKSTGRDLFNPAWLETYVAKHLSLSPVDAQATLLQLTAVSIVDAVLGYASSAEEIFICGGGAYNTALMKALTARFAPRAVQSTEALGVSAQYVEALAFAWLARETLSRRPGNLPTVTGAAGLRVLGAVYPA